MFPHRIVDNAIGSAANGYAFPTNLDRDQPLKGLTNDAQVDVVRRAVDEEWSAEKVGAELPRLRLPPVDPRRASLLKKPALRQLDLVDKATLPLFAVTMLAEYAALEEACRSARSATCTTPTNGRCRERIFRRDPLVPLGYERKDTVASLAMLAGNIAFGFATLSVFSKFDRFLFKHRVSDVGMRRGSIATAMVLWDFLYYWDHRWMHEVRLLWANHVTHHSGERYNLSTALRQPWSGFLTFWVFAPMPLLGFPTAKTAKAGQLNLLYQYWIHTEAIDQLPKAIETVFNTPSHHRGHHGANEQYLDKNYGGILILWDRAVRHVRARATPRQVRPDEEHPHVQPAADRLPRDGRHRPRRARLEGPARQVPPRVRPPGLDAGR